METLQTQLHTLKLFPVILLAVLIPGVLAVFLGWKSILLFLVPFLFWVFLRHFKNGITTFIFFYLIVHLAASSFIFSGSGFISVARVAAFFGLVSVISLYYMFTPKKLNTFKFSSSSYAVLFLLLAVLVLGSLNSLNPPEALSYLVWYLAFMFLIIFLLPKEYGSIPSMINLFYALMLGGLLYEISTVFTVTTGGITDRGGNIAIRGLFVNNNMAGMVALSTSVLTFIVLGHKQYLTQGKALIVKISALVSPLLVIFSSSRASILGLVTAVLLLGVVEKRTRKLSILTFVLLVILFLFGQAILYDWFRVGTLMESGGIFGERTLLYKYALQSIPYIPWYGLGIGMQGDLYQINLSIPPDIIGEDGNLLGFHNAYLQIMVETGIVGLLIYSLILLVTFRKAFTTGGEEPRKLNLSIALVLLGLMVNSFFESALLQPGSPYSLIFWTMVCFVHVIHYQARKEIPERKKRKRVKITW